MAIPIIAWIKSEKQNFKLRWRITLGLIAIFSTTFLGLFANEISKIGLYYAQDFKYMRTRSIVENIKEELEKDKNQSTRIKIAIKSLEDLSKTINKGDVWEEAKALKKLKQDIKMRFYEAEPEDNSK